MHFLSLQVEVNQGAILMCKSFEASCFLKPNQLGINIELNIELLITLSCMIQLFLTKSNKWLKFNKQKSTN
jgi:hypothetical protein